MEKLDIYPFRRTESSRSSKRELPINANLFKSLTEKMRVVISLNVLPLALMSFFCGRAVILGELSPFGIAFSAGITALFPDYGLISVIFSIAGCATSLSDGKLGAMIAAVLFTFPLMVKYNQQLRQKWYGPPAVVFVVSLVCKVAVFAYAGADLYKYLTICIEALLAAGLTYVFYRSAPLLRNRKIRSFKWEERLFVVFSLVGVIAGLSGLNIYMIDPQRVFSGLLVMLAVFIGGAGWGAAVGTLAGVVPSISSMVSPGIIGFFSLAGLTGGIFRGFGRMGVCLGYILGNLLLSLYFNGSTSLWSAFLEVGLAVALFMLIPPKNLQKLKGFSRAIFGEHVKGSRDQQVRDYTARKIRDFGRVFNEVAKTVDEVSCDLQAAADADLQQVFNGITAKVCTGCSLYRICWEADFYKTYKNIMDLIATLDFKQRVEEHQLSPDLQKRCVRAKDLAITVNCLNETYKTNHFWKRKMVESREVVSGQLRGVSAILQKLASEVRVDIQMREDIEAIVKSELAKSGNSVIDLTVMSLGEDKLEVNVTAASCGGRKHCAKVINPIVSKLLGQRMTVLNNNYCTKKTGESICEFKLHPARTYSLNIGHAKAAKNGISISGDSISTVELGDGKYALLMSDGMGVGAKAAQESSATIDLLEKLMETGFDKNLAVKTVNSVLVLRTPDETFSTVDMTVIDQYSGTGEFLKIGAAPSFIKRAERVDVVKQSSLPMGILNNIEVDSIDCQLNIGDVVVMATDGVLDSKKDGAGKEDWLVTLLQSVKTTEPQNIADLILNRAIQNTGGIVDDDMTVLVAEIIAGPVH